MYVRVYVFIYTLPGRACSVDIYIIVYDLNSNLLYLFYNICNFYCYSVYTIIYYLEILIIIYVYIYIFHNCI